MSIFQRAGRILTFSILGASALAAVGCGSSQERSWTLAAPAAEAFSDGPAIDIENHRGSVEVRVEPWRSDVNVSFRTTIAGDHSGDRARSIREGMNYDAGSNAADGPPVITIRALTAVPDDTDHSTRILVRMPACGGVRVRNAGGPVLIVGAGGAMQVENADGSVEVRTDRVIDAPALLTTTKGNVRWQIPLASRAAFDAETGDGVIVIDNAAPGQNDWSATWSGPRKVAGTLNSGQNAVSLRTLEGDIRVILLKDPFGRVGLIR